MICKNELSRYLELCIAHLREFCDEVVVFDDGSEDGSLEWLFNQCASRKPNCAYGRGLYVEWDTGRDSRESLFVGHAGKRQRLLDITLSRDPTHILAIDADEFVTDGAAIRRACEDDGYDSWGLCMQEVWNASPDGLQIRQDGGWVEHDVSMLWRPATLSGNMMIVDRGPATGRTPDSVGLGSYGHTCSGCLHFGWTDRLARAARYQRYVVADGGRYHQRAHLDSIMLPDEQIGLSSLPWPEPLAGYRDAILARVGQP